MALGVAGEVGDWVPGSEPTVTEAIILFPCLRSGILLALDTLQFLLCILHNEP